MEKQSKVRGIWTAWGLVGDAVLQEEVVDPGRPHRQSNAWAAENLKYQPCSWEQGVGGWGLQGWGACSRQRGCPGPKEGRAVCWREGPAGGRSGWSCWRWGWGDRACGTSKVLHLQVERDPLQGAVRGSAWHIHSDQRSGCCDQTRPEQKTGNQVEAFRSTIQVCNEDQRGGHRCREKQSASGYLIHLLFKEVILEFIVEIVVK